MSVLSLLVLAAFAQAEAHDPAPVRVPVVEEEGTPVFHSVSAYLRINFLSGDLTRDGLGYSDIFSAGFGAGLEGDRTYLLASDLTLGGYVSLGYDGFTGDRYRDDLGDTLSPERLDLFTVLGGAKLRLLMEEPVFSGHPIFTELRVGAGLACYASTEAEYVVGGTPGKADLFESSVAGAFEVAFRTGVTSRSFCFMAGIGFRWLGPPERGDDMAEKFEPESAVDVILELGYQIQF